MCQLQRKVLLVLCMLGLLPGAVHGTTATGSCTSVIDGDTLAVQVEGRNQTFDLEGIDAPELDQAQGEAAKDFLSTLILEKKVQVEVTNPKTHPPMARVMLDGKDISREMLAAGFAWIGETDDEDYALAAIMARSEKKGLWQEAHPIPPSAWRNRQPIPTPTPTPEPAIRDLSEMAARTELEKNRRGKTVISGLPQVKSEEQNKTDETPGAPSLHMEFSCPQDGLEACAEAQFKSSYERAAGRSPGAVARSEQTSEGGGHLFIFTGDGFSVPVVCQCPEDSPCTCAIDVTTTKETSTEVTTGETSQGQTGS